jgi:hypothetical protein
MEPKKITSQPFNPRRRPTYLDNHTETHEVVLQVSSRNCICAWWRSSCSILIGHACARSKAMAADPSMEGVGQREASSLIDDHLCSYTSLKVING